MTKGMLFIDINFYVKLNFFITTVYCASAVYALHGDIDTYRLVTNYCKIDAPRI